jgi:putative aldouronate transport system permease protein
MAKFEKGSKIKVSTGDRVFAIVCYVIVGLFALACLYPFLLVVAASFTDEQTLVLEGYKLIMSKFSTSAYKGLFATQQIYHSYGVTVFITLVGTVLSMLVTCAMAYALSVKNMKSRGHLAFFMYFTMLFNGGLVPSYLLISKYLGMRDTIWVYIIPALVNAWNCLLLRNFFQAIPESLSESAKIDGANDILILFKIVLPISLPGLATIGLFYALAYWNEWYKAMLYIDSEKLVSLQYLIMKILRNADFMASTAGTSITVDIPTLTTRMATVVATIGPIILLYPFLQKYFVGGLTVGGVKG